MSSSEGNLLQIFEKARELNLCPNRLWNSAGENLNKIIPDLDLIAQLNNASDGFRQYNSDNDHSHCVPNLCEYSKRDFTSVQQRHECTDATTCFELRVSFRAKILKDAVKNDLPTVWTLDRASILKSPLPYMAISHVWSDGTGAGPSGDGSVNNCLFRHFADIAMQYQCQGIWWDTMCIPRDKATRSKAIQKIQSSYENARFTLVHDCFLRNWVWRPDTACFAILMSPWFSRGWTALELLKSPRVKIIFKGPNGPLIKDLDEEILAKESDPDGPRKEASHIIRRLRHRIMTVNDLLSVLKSRSTSWPKDIHVIAALLLDITAAQGQQETYRKILQKIGKICPGHLFHNAVPMSNSFTWCPAEFMEMPLDPSTPSLNVLQNGDIRGRWYVSALPADLEARCSLSSIFGMTRLRLEAALRYSTECFLLIELGEKESKRALVVRAITKSHFQYIAAVSFYQGFIPTDTCEEMEVTILSSPHDIGEAQPAIDMNSEIRRIASKEETLHSAIWKGDFDTFIELLSPQNAEVPDELGRSPLHLAAERGNCAMVEHLLLILQVDAGAVCNEGQTVWHKAAWAGSTEVTRILLRFEITGACQKDKHKNTALHLAAQMGFAPIVKLLATHDTINTRCANGLIPLHHAAMNGDIEVAKLLTGSDLEAKDTRFGWAPLHCAADSGNEDVVRLLLHHGANIQASDSLEKWTPLHLASMNGHLAVVKLLLGRHARATVQDRHYWTARKFAEINGHTEVLDCFPSEDIHEIFQENVFPPDSYWTPLHCRAINGQPGITKVLTSPKLPMYLEGVLEGWTPLKFSSRASLGVAFNRLFATQSSSKRVEGSTLLHWTVKNNSFSATETLLKEGYDVEATDVDGNRPLHYAALHADDLVLQILLDAGVNVLSITPERVTALHAAALSRRPEVLRLLLESRLDKESKDKNGRTPLMVAAQVGNKAAAGLLLEAGANKEAVSSLGRRPLMYAAVSGQTATTQLLVEFGSDVNAADKEKKTALMYAAENGNAQVAECLIRSGADIGLSTAVSDIGKSGRTALHLACMNGHEGVVRVLINASSDVDLRDKGGLAPIQLAANAGHDRVICMLILAGGDSSAIGKDGKSPLFSAIIRGQIDIARALIESGMSIQPNGSGFDERIISAASEGGYEDIVRMLLDAGEDPDPDPDPDSSDPFNPHNMSPLALAAQNGHEGIAQMLIKAGAHTEAINFRGETALFLSAGKGHENIVRILLDAGANPCAPRKQKAAPLCSAVKSGHEIIVQMLINAGADPNTFDNRPECPPLCLAARTGHENIVRMLLNAGADPDGRRDDTMSPLSSAAEGGHNGIVQILLDAGASPDGLIGHKVSPLGSASKAGYESILRRLLDAGAGPDGLGGHKASPLCYAAEGGHESVVQLLIDAGANPNSAAFDIRPTFPPLCLAARGGHEGTMRILMKAGAYIEIKGSQKRTPLLEAVVCGHVQTVRFLINSGANLEARPPALEMLSPLSSCTTRYANPVYWAFSTPLILAAREGHTQIVLDLIQAGADVDAWDQLQRTALHWAATRNDRTMVAGLLQAGADPKVLDFEDRLPWDLAPWSEVKYLCAIDTPGPTRLGDRVKRLWSRHARGSSNTT